MLVKIKFTFPTGNMTIKNTFDSFYHVTEYIACEKSTQEHNGIWATDIKIEILAYTTEKEV